MPHMKKFGVIDRPPAHLRAAGRALWSTVTTEYPMNSTAKSILVQACESLDRVRASQAEIRRDGATIADRFKQLRQHPALKTEVDARTSLLRCLRLLNFDLSLVETHEAEEQS
jgi:P27 family predicted phage terminase small subunit